VGPAGACATVQGGLKSFRLSTILTPWGAMARFLMAAPSPLDHALQRERKMLVQLITADLSPKALLARLLAKFPAISEQRCGPGDRRGLDFEQGLAGFAVCIGGGLGGGLIADPPL
jgi:hypothetical protein